MIFQAEINRIDILNHQGISALHVILIGLSWLKWMLPRSVIWLMYYFL